MPEITKNKLSLFSEDLKQTTLPIPIKHFKIAEEFLSGQDFPTTRSERFKYTRLAKLANANFSEPQQIYDHNFQKHGVIKDAYRVIISNQHISIPDNLPYGVQIEHIKNSDIPFHNCSFKDVFGALNNLYANQGISVKIANNLTLDKPIEIIQIHGGGKFYYRHHFQFGSNSEAQVYIISKQIEQTKSYAHSHFQYDIGQDSRIKIFKIQDTSTGHFDFNEDRAKQAKNSQFQINTLTIDGSFVRNDTQVEVLGEYAQTYLNGAYWLNGEQHVANYTTIDHLVPNCESFETYKGMAADNSVAVFNGKVFVRKQAQKTNAFQSNSNVLLSENASVNSKPELEIYADDVKCSHGSTTGQLDENALFYLRARGLSAATSKSLLLKAFMDDVLQFVNQLEMLEYIEERISKRFNWSY